MFALTPQLCPGQFNEAGVSVQGVLRLVRRLEASPGTSVFLPRGVPHTFQNICGSPARLLGLVAPAGMECFFRALAHVCEHGSPERGVLVPLFEKHGLELLGPPLAER